MIRVRVRIDGPYEVWPAYRAELEADHHDPARLVTVSRFRWWWWRALRWAERRLAAELERVRSE